MMFALIEDSEEPELVVALQASYFVNSTVLNQQDNGWESKQCLQKMDIIEKFNLDLQDVSGLNLLT